MINCSRLAYGCYLFILSLLFVVADCSDDNTGSDDIDLLLRCEESLDSEVKCLEEMSDLSVSDLKCEENLEDVVSSKYGIDDNLVPEIIHYIVEKIAYNGKEFTYKWMRSDFGPRLIQVYQCTNVSDLLNDIHAEMGVVLDEERAVKMMKDAGVYQTYINDQLDIIKNVPLLKELLDNYIGHHFSSTEIQKLIELNTYPLPIIDTAVIDVYYSKSI